MRPASKEHFVFVQIGLCLLLSVSVWGKDVTSEFSSDGFSIFYEGQVTSIYVDANAPTVCHIAARKLSKDIERVCGVKPAVFCDRKKLTGQVIFIAVTDGALMKQLSKKPNVSDIKDQWESWIEQVVDSPLAKVERGLFIIGSDCRGAAFGVFELSKRIGVSPWYWWADVPVKHRDTIVVRRGRRVHGPPSVKYRGIFINDEDWGLHRWAKNTYAPEDKGIGPKTYEKVFELMLRLKANYLWPAMHPCTKAFNAYEENKKLADDYAIVMGSSHCEPMLRNNVYEWKEWQPPDGSERGDWDWCNNSTQIVDYWKQRVKANAAYENIYTVGMRGIHDSGMPCSGASREQKVEKMENEVIPAQRRILSKYVNPVVSEVEQIFCPYKEVLELYDMGMDLPEDITILWPDDNHGYIRRLSNPAERSRSGEAGVYYHISYWGAPHDYLWLCSTPPVLVWEEMKKAYDYRARRVWVLNVGDIKPAEILMDLFMQMGWDIKRWNEKNIDRYLVQWAKRTFGKRFAQDIAGIMHEYYRLAQARKPEHMGWSTIYPDTPRDDPGFIPVHYGDESQRRVRQYKQIEDRARKILAQLPESHKDAFYQLVYYPVRGASLMNQKYIYAHKSRLYAEQGRVSSNRYAEMAIEAHNDIIEETNRYNNTLSKGKWKGMMCWNPRELAVFHKPEVSSIEPISGSSMGVIIEGQITLASRKTDGGTAHNRLPDFNRFTKPKYFIDIFNKGDAPFEWEAKVSAPWVELSTSSGTIKQEKRIWVSIDWEQVPSDKECNSAITITGADRSVTVEVRAINPSFPDSAEERSFIQTNGYVSIEAEHFTAQTNDNQAVWTVIPMLGRTGDSVMVLPTTIQSFEDVAEIISRSPTLEYTVYLDKPGTQQVKVYCLPTHSVTDKRGLRYAISFDDSQPEIVGYDTSEWSKPWRGNVLRGAAVSTSSHSLSRAGKHTLKIRMVDPGVVIDKIVIGDAPSGYLGPPETDFDKTGCD